MMSSFEQSKTEQNKQGSLRMFGLVSSFFFLSVIKIKPLESGRLQLDQLCHLPATELQIT